MWMCLLWVGVYVPVLYHSTQACYPTMCVYVHVDICIHMDTCIQYMLPCGISLWLSVCGWLAAVQVASATCCALVAGVGRWVFIILYKKRIAVCSVMLNVFAYLKGYFLRSQINEICCRDRCSGKVNAHFFEFW